jgi:hypothetical protein
VIIFQTSLSIFRKAQLSPSCPPEGLVRASMETFFMNSDVEQWWAFRRESAAKKRRT